MATLYRIAAETREYRADDLSGAGAKATGGRWNSPGTAVVYCSTSIALACLETVVHFKASSLPLNRYLVAIDVSGEVWARRAVVDAPPVGWDAAPAGMTSIELGNEWVTQGKTALLLVPSVIVPEEYNVLLNPKHADTAGIAANKLRRWTYDARLRS